MRKSFLHVHCMHDYFSYQQTSLAGGVAYWSYGLNEAASSARRSRMSPRVQSKQLELNHRWSHGV